MRNSVKIGLLVWALAVVVNDEKARLLGNDSEPLRAETLDSSERMPTHASERSARLQTFMECMQQMQNAGGCKSIAERISEKKDLPTK